MSDTSKTSGTKISGSKTSSLNTSALKIQKTIKLYINGAFARTESGRSFKVLDQAGNTYAHLCLASRKDFRNAVEKAAPAQRAWQSKTAYNRAQILYRMAEMAESKRQEFNNILENTTDHKEKENQVLVDNIIDTFVYYAGFCDKYQQLMGSINPVAGPHHNFTTPDAVGVVGIFSEAEESFQSFLDQMCSSLVSQNSVVGLIPKKYAALLAPLSEVLATSDLPNGVVNLLTGEPDELAEYYATHFEVNSLCYIGNNDDRKKLFQTEAADNMKRVVLKTNQHQSLENILNFVEYKTVWHPA